MSTIMWKDIISPNEMEFIAENYLVEIIPNFHEEKIALISGTYGPFKPNRKIRLPLWLAVKLRKNGKCNIIPPQNLDNNSLKMILEHEKKESELFGLPNDFFEIANILFNQAEDDFDEIKVAKSYVADIMAVRQEKINKILQTITNQDLILKINQLTNTEIEQVRPLLDKIFTQRLNILNSVDVNPTAYPLFNGFIEIADENNNVNDNFNEGFN